MLYFRGQFSKASFAFFKNDAPHLGIVANLAVLLKTKGAWVIVFQETFPASTSKNLIFYMGMMVIFLTFSVDTVFYVKKFWVLSLRLQKIQFG